MTKQEYEIISIMDNNFDYVWWEDDKGFHFVDRLYYDTGHKDNTGEERDFTNELEMCFGTLEEVKEWINKKEKENK